MTKSEKQFQELSPLGRTHKQDIHQHELIQEIMLQGYKKNKKIWWFAYELMGHWSIKGKNYFMSYKASTRVSELSGDGIVESRKTEGKMHLYALIDLI